MDDTSHTTICGGDEKVVGLFRLPAELRNSIYEFVLTARDDLHYQEMSPNYPCSSTSILCSNKSGDGHEFNQLKYANRQLYTETAGLELKFNTIFFAQVTGCGRSPVAQLLRFVQGTRRRPNLACLRHITLISRDRDPSTPKFDPFLPDTFEDMLKLGEFCMHNLQITVKYIISSFGSKATDYKCYSVGLWDSGACFLRALRNVDARFLFQDGDPYNFSGRTRAFAERWRGSSAIADCEGFATPNLRFWPVHAAISEEFVEEVKDSLLVINGFRPDHWIRWVNCAKEWMENGI